MPRRPKPWRRGGKAGPWYSQVKGEQVWLAPPEATKTEAQQVLDALVVEARKGDRPRVGGLTFTDAANLFLAHGRGAVGRGELKPVTLEGYERFLVPASDGFGRHPVSALKAAHVSAWLDGQPGWGPTTRNNAITAVKACLNWARKAGHVPENPLRDMAKPRARVTETDLPPAKAAAALGAPRDRPFRDFLAVLWGTGARPSEVMALEARHLDLAAGAASLDGKTTGATGRKRVIYLGGGSAAVLRRLAALYPEGPLLRNAKGNAWTRHALAGRFRRLRGPLKMGRELTAKGFRHGFATDGLEKGVPVATVAELMGHASTKMVERHYSKLRERTEHLRAAAGKVRPEAGDG